MEPLKSKTEKAEAEVAKVFQGKDVEENIGILSRLTGSFVEPLLETAQTKKVVID